MWSTRGTEARERTPGLGAAAFVLLAACLLGSCNVGGEKGRTYLEIRADSAWSRYDTLHIAWADTLTGAGADLFRGTPAEFGVVKRLPAEGYRGQLIAITVKGILGGKTVHVEVLRYDGAAGDVLEVRPLVLAGTTLSFDPTALPLGEKDSLEIPAVKVSPEELFDKSIRYASSDTGVFVVRGGLIVARGKGTAVLTGQLNSDLTKVFAITVIVSAYETPVQSVEFATDSIRIFAGGAPESLMVAVKPAGANPGLEFRVSDTSKAGISGRRISGRAVGAVIVTAVSKGDTTRRDQLKVVIEASPNNGKPVPVPPALASLQAEDGKVTAAWSAVAGADTYDLYYDEGATVDKSGFRIRSVVSPQSISGLKNGTAYAFALSASNASGESPLGPVKTATPVAAAPGAPVLAVQGGGDGLVTVAWAAVPGADGYVIYHAAGSTVDKANSKVANATSPFPLTGLVNGTLYAIAVSAVKEGKESDLSNVITATPQVPAPQAPVIGAASGGNGQATLTWTAAAGAQSYRVYYRAGATVDKSATHDTAAGPPKVIAGLLNGTEYAFAVTAVSAGGESPLSGIATATPRPPAPGAPVLTGAKNGEAMATVTWEPVPGATAYHLYYAQGATVAKTSTRVADVASPAVVTGLTTCRQYSFAVTAVTAGGESELSNPLATTISPGLLTLSTQPSTQERCLGVPAEFSVTVGATAGAVTYQWKLNSSDIAGATSSTYSIAGVGPEHVGRYTCMVKDACGFQEVETRAASLFLFTPPTITTDLVDPPVLHVGGSVTLSVTAEGSGTLGYQWKQGTAIFGGATSNTLRLQNLQLTSHNMTYSCLVTNSCGPGTLSATATLKIDAIAKVASGDQHFLALTAAGVLWGGGIKEPLGSATYVGRNLVQVATGVKDAWGGSGKTFFTKTDGSLWALGDNRQGGLGTGDTLSASAPVRVYLSGGAPLTNVVKVVSGTWSTLFLRSDGTVWGCSNTNHSGQLGNGTKTASLYPTQMLVSAGVPLTGVTDVATGNDFSFALNSTGTLFGCGNNQHNQFCLPTNTSPAYATQIQAGVDKIGSSLGSTLFLKGTTLWAAGLNEKGQFGTGGTTPLTAFTAIQTGVTDFSSWDYALLIRKTDGSIWGSGEEGFGQFGGPISDGFAEHHRPVKVMDGGVSSFQTGGWVSAFLMLDGYLRAAGAGLGNTFDNLDF